MSGLCEVYVMFAGTVEGSRLPQTSGKSTYTCHPSSAAELIAIELYTSQRTRLCLHVYHPWFSIFLQLLRVCIRISLPPLNSHLVSDFFHHLWRLLAVVNMSRIEFRRNFVTLQGMLQIYDFHVNPSSINLITLNFWISLWIWSFHLSTISSFTYALTVCFRWGSSSRLGSLMLRVSLPWLPCNFPHNT